jgi:hypothetical protein
VGTDSIPNQKNVIKGFRAFLLFGWNIFEDIELSLDNGMRDLKGEGSIISLTRKNYSVVYVGFIAATTNSLRRLPIG